MNVRITGTSEEVKELVELLPAILDVRNISREYPNRGSKDVRVYVDGTVEAKPKWSNMELEQLIKEALKDYRGNNRVIVSTSTGGTIEVEDFDANSLIEENSELEDKNTELQQEIEELERKIEELEEEKE